MKKIMLFLVIGLFLGMGCSSRIAEISPPSLLPSMEIPETPPEQPIEEPIEVVECTTEADCIKSNKCSTGIECSCVNNKCYVGFVAPPEEFCTKEGTNARLSLSDAKQIARSSECGTAFKERYMCNKITGTWWIDLDISKEGCAPACVVNVITKKAEINWRCTGLIVP